jgi:hypothetical protein
MSESHSHVNPNQVVYLLTDFKAAKYFDLLFESNRSIEISFMR